MTDDPINQYTTAWGQPPSAPRRPWVLGFAGGVLVLVLGIVVGTIMLVVPIQAWERAVSQAPVYSANSGQPFLVAVVGGVALMMVFNRRRNGTPMDAPPSEALRSASSRMKSLRDDLYWLG